MDLKKKYRDMKLKILAKTMSKDEAGMVEAVDITIMVVIIAVAGWIGLQILDTVSTQVGLDNTSEFYNASISITDIVTDSFSLIGVVVLVAIFSVIIRYLLNLTGTRR